MHEWKAGDVAYAAVAGFLGEGVTVNNAEVRKVGKGFVDLSEREEAWRYRARVGPTEVHPTRKAALEAFAKAQTEHAEQCDAEARKLRALAERAREMAKEEP